MPTRSQAVRLLFAALLPAALATGSIPPAFGQPATVTPEPLSDRRVSYTMDVALDPEARTVTGSQRITWRNPDRVPVGEVQFHLYLNAFKSPRTTFMTESGGTHRGFAAGTDSADASPWGHITVDRMRLASPDDEAPTPPDPDDETTDLTDRIRFIQTTSDNPNDSTVIAVALPRPVAPGETIALDVDFTARLPRIFARTGWERADNDSLFFLVGQWFPKLGVYEVPGQRYVPADTARGRWSTHQFHANSEFYADFGVYDVTITTPLQYLVGATGVQTNERTGAGTRTVTYRAEDVHDFAWTAGSDLLEYTDTWRHVQLRLLLQPAHRAQAERHFEAAKVALSHFDAWVGPYPYTTLTLVDGLGGSNGMEYPMFITCGTTYMLPSWVRLLEVVTIHEFGHQYFYGLLASNEAEEAWLDEGINSYLELRILDTAYGEGSVIDLPGFPFSDGDLQRLSYTQNVPERGPIFLRSWEYMTRGDYGKATYSKPATVLKTLEGYLGWDTMQAVLQTYYERWRFRHPTTRDFIAVVEEVAGRDLDWFFEPYVYGTAVVDYAVTDLSASPEGDTYRSTVTAARLQDGVFPHTLRVRFADETTEDLTWDGTEPARTFTFDRPTPIVEAYLDPENLVWLDVNRLNNRQRIEPERTYARRQQLKLVTLLQQVFVLLF